MAVQIDPERLCQTGFVKQMSFKPGKIVYVAFNPLTPTVAVWVQTGIKHPVPNRVKPSFVIFDIRAL